MISPEIVTTEARRLIEAGDPEEALRQLDRGLERWPHSNALRLRRAETLLAAGNFDAATEVLQAVLAGPAAAQAAKLLVEFLKAEIPSVERGRLLVDAVAAAEVPAALKHEVFEALSEAVANAPDADEVVAHIAWNSGLHRYEWRYAVQLAEQEDFSGSIAMLRHAQASGALPARSTMLLADLLLSEDRNDEAAALLRELVEQEPDRPEAYRKLIMTLQRQRDFEAASEVLEAALRKWPNDWMMLFRLNRMPMPADAFARCLPLLNDAQAEKEPRYRIHLAIARASQGEFAEAFRLLDQEFPDRLEDLVAPIRAVFRSRPVAFWKTRNRLDNDRLAEVQVTRSAGASATVVVPTGITFGLLPIEMLDALLAEAGVNAIYLRDFRKRLFAGGVETLGGGLRETVDGLRSILDDLGTERTIFLGCSGGGFAAHLLGAVAGADAAVSFAGPVNIETYYGDTRPAIWNQEFLDRHVLMRQTGLSLDTRPFIQAATETRFIHVHGKGMARDSAQAALLADLEGVEIVSDDKISDHLVVNHMIADGRFEAILKELSLPAGQA